MIRNLTLDYFKLFLSILVILIHMDPIFGTWDSLLGFEISNGFCRIAVPAFFLINGYFLTSKIDNWSLVKKYLIRLFILTLVWSLIYIPFIPTPVFEKKIFYFFMGIHHLWYLPALIVGTLLFYPAHKYISNKKVLLLVALALFLVGYYIQFTFKGIDYNPMNPFKYRNGLFLAFPFLVLGSYIRKNQEKLINISNVLLVAILLFSCVTLYIEAYYSFKVLYLSDVYLTLPVICSVSFLLVVKNAKFGESDIQKSQLSEAVFFIHPLILVFVFNGLGMKGLDNSLIVLPIILLFTFIFSIGLIELNKRLKYFL